MLGIIQKLYGLWCTCLYAFCLRENDISMSLYILDVLHVLSTRLLGKSQPVCYMCVNATLP